MKRKGIKILAMAMTCFVAVLIAVLLWDRHAVGRRIDSYKGVEVYDNGLLFFRSCGKNYSADGYYYGQKWQCVEFVKRFYFQAKNHRMPDVMGHARSFFDDALPDGASNPRRGLVQYRNGSTNKPVPDDLLVFADTRFGHVAIVTDVGTNSLHVIQQNILSGSRASFTLVESNEHWFVTSPRIPAGWLRQ